MLFCRSDIADRMIEMLTGAMDELRVGDPGLLATDVGPVIDEDARAPLLAHIERMEREARLLSAVPLGPDTNDGSFFAPHAFEIGSIGQLDREVFGPILHVVRWRAGDLDRVIEQINVDRLRPDARHTQPHRRDRRAVIATASMSATSTSTAT